MHGYKWPINCTRTRTQHVSASSKAILLNPELLQISQDPLARAGRRFYHDLSSGGQGWIRELQVRADIIGHGRNNM